MLDFDALAKEGKTVIYKESKTELNGDWDFWGERKTVQEHVYVYRKVVTFEEAEQHEMEEALLN